MSASSIPGLTPRVERFIRRLSTVAVAVLAVSAAVLSFGGLRDLAVQSGFPTTVAWLLPVIVDGMVLTGSLAVVTAGMVGLRPWYGWMLTLLGVVISVAGNVAAAPDTLTAQLVHAIAPVTFALSVEGLLRVFRASAHAAAHREQVMSEQQDKAAERAARAEERQARLEALRLQATMTAPVQPAATSAASPATAPVAATGPAVALSAAAGSSRISAKEKVAAVLSAHPDWSAGQVSRELGMDPSYARKLVRDVRGDVSA